MAASPGTGIYQVRKAVADALDALPAFNGVSVNYGLRRLDNVREQVWTQRGEFDVEPAGLRSDYTFRNETGDFEVVVFVRMPSGSTDAAAERAVELGYVIEGWVATKANWRNNALGIQLHSLTVQGRGTLTEAIDASNGALAELVYPIRYTARLEV